MSIFSLRHLCDGTLVRDFAAQVAQDCTTTAMLLAYIAEIDRRKLYLPAAYSSMFTYCVGEFRFSEDIALKRIRVARVARRFPIIFEYLADGRLNLTAILLLRPYLIKRKTAQELLAAAVNKTNAEIKRLLVHRFPRPDVPTRIEQVAVLASPLLANEQVAVRPVEAESEAAKTNELQAFESAESARPRVEPLSPQRFKFQMTISEATLEKLRYATELVSHQIPSGDVAEVFDRALDALIHKLEKTKFAATERPRPVQPHSSANSRYVPAHVRRAVTERDGNRCTYVSEAGRRCEERKFLQFDHVLEVARGGRATVDQIRLRCRAHNQFTAEQTFGAEFMKNKREEARRAAEARARAKAAKERTEVAIQEIIPWLRQLGFRADEARRAASLCESIPDAPLEERVRVALSSLAPSRAVRHGANHQEAVA